MLLVGSAIAAGAACGGKIWQDPDCHALSGIYSYPVTLGREVGGDAACPNLEGARFDFNINFGDRVAGFWSASAQPSALAVYTTPTGGGSYDRTTCIADLPWNRDKPYFNGCPDSVLVNVTFDDAGSFTGTLQIDVRCGADAGASLSCSYPFNAGHESSGRL